MSHMTVEKRPVVDRTHSFNRVGYVAFLLLAAYFAILKNDWGSAVSNLGIGLIFDPFDHRVSWGNRPRFQQIWLLTHVALVVVLLIVVLFRS